MKKYITTIVLFLGVLFLVAGCSVEKEDFTKIKDLEFSLVEESDIPEELKKLIEEKKTEEFKMSFDSGDIKYIVVGYGTQTTGGYSISVDELYLAKNAIYINTTLIGPSKGEKVTQVETYPYIIIKTEYVDKSIVFE